MTGIVKANFLQIGDSATATQNLTLRTNVDGTFTIARGNIGATTQDISTINAAGGITFAGNMTVSGAAILNGTTTFNGTTTINGVTSIPNLIPLNKPHFSGELSAVGPATSPVPTLNTYLVKDMTLGSNRVTAQIAGRYYVKAQQLVQATTENIFLIIRKNGSTVCHAWVINNSMQDAIISGIVDMAVNDYIDFAWGGLVNYAWGGAHSNVSIFMI